MEGFAGSVFEQADPAVPATEAALIVRTLFNIRCRARSLGGERDQNFAIVAETGARFILKLSHSGEDPGLSELQTAALIAIATIDPGLPVPRFILTASGDVQPTLTTAQGVKITARLLTVVPGVPLGDTPLERRQPEKIGVALARLDQALLDFRHPWENHDLLWDLKKAIRCRSLMAHLEDRRTRDVAERGFDIFDRVAAPMLRDLRVQMIHNDLNPHNIFVNPRTGDVTGVIDLGDAVRAPLVQDVAVACAYQVAPGDDPLGLAADLAAGFHSVTPLEHEEFAVLPALVAGRLAMSIAIAGWRAGLHPQNKAYIVRNTASSVAALDALLQIRTSAAVNRMSARVRA